MVFKMAFPKRRLAIFICFIVFPSALVFTSLRLLSSLQAPSSADPASTAKGDTAWLSFHRLFQNHHLHHHDHHNHEFRHQPEVVMTASSGPNSDEVSQDVLNPSGPRVEVDGHPLKFPERTSEEVSSAATLRTDHGCLVPNFQPRDAITDMFSERSPALECEAGEPWVTASVDGALFLNATLLSRQRERAENCSYEEIVRLKDEDVAFAEPVAFRESVRPPADFVRVQCDVTSLVTGKTRKYTAYHFLMREKPALEETLQQRMRERKRKRQARDSSSLPKTGETAPDWINVIMLGVDSTSRHNMIRQMPKTRHFLLEELEAVEMSNYNKVADNTFPNMFALMSGLTLEEAEWMKTVEKARAQAPKEGVEWETLGHRFLWQDFADAGYRTLYNEDLHRINIFFVENIHFRQEPTYFYGPPLEIAKEEYSGMFTRGGRCFGGKPSDRLMLSYPLEFARLFRNKPHYSFSFLVRTTHNNLNGPGQMDGEVSGFLRQLQTEGLLNNTLLLLFSDHGLRYGPFRMTPPGKFEEARPFMFLALPRRFRRQWPQLAGRVQSNAALFTTPLDVHATLLDLLSLHHAADPRQGLRKPGRGLSLFRTIPTNRSCLDAGVPAHFCVCLAAERPLSATSPAATAAGSVLIAALNAALANVRDKCHTLTLSQVVGFVQLRGQEDYVRHYCGKPQPRWTSSDLAHEGEPAFYRVTLVATPGGGLFEATLVRCGVDVPFRFVGEFAHISRLNKYGEASVCVGWSHFLEKICFCKDGQGRA